MEHKVRSNAKTWLLVTLALALLTLMLLPAMAFAKVDVHINQQNDSVRLEVKNTGEKSTFLLNSLTVSDDSGKKVYTSQETSSADLLNLEPGVSYAFEWNIDSVPEGKYIQKIYQGDDRRDLRAISFDFVRGKRHNKPMFYADKKFYKYGENVDIAFMNMGTNKIYVNVNNWEIRNRDTGKVVFSLSKDCTFGYSDCGDSFEPLRFLKTIEKTWYQKDSNGNQVASGKYDVTVEYSDKDPSSGKIRIETITTNKFYIRPSAPIPVPRGDLNGNGISADAGDLDLMEQASTGEIISDSRYDLNNNGIPADAGDLVLMKRASNGEINLQKDTG
jgi:hypothetical protein